MDRGHGLIRVLDGIIIDDVRLRGTELVTLSTDHGRDESKWPMGDLRIQRYGDHKIWGPKQVATRSK
jgi:hypothetical protein